MWAEVVLQTGKKLVRPRTIAKYTVAYFADGRGRDPV